MQLDQASGRRFTGLIQRDPEAPAKPHRIIPTPPMATRVPSDGRASAGSPFPRPGEGGQHLGPPVGLDNMDRMGEVHACNMHV